MATRGEEAKHIIARGKSTRPTIPEATPSTLENLIRKCWSGETEFFSDCERVEPIQLRGRGSSSFLPSLTKLGFSVIAMSPNYLALGPGHREDFFHPPNIRICKNGLP